MAEEEEISVVNTQLLTGPEEIADPVPDAEVARREIINIPSQPAGNFEAASPSSLKINNDMPVDELLNSNHPRKFSRCSKRMFLVVALVSAKEITSPNFSA